MTNIDPRTPQLTVVKGIFDGYCTLNTTKNVLPLLAKDFKAQNFPKNPELPDETREEHVEKWGRIYAIFAKLEVRIWHQPWNLLLVWNLISPTCRLSLTR